MLSLQRRASSNDIEGQISLASFIALFYNFMQSAVIKVDFTLGLFDLISEVVSTRAYTEAVDVCIHIFPNVTSS